MHALDKPLVVLEPGGGYFRIQDPKISRWHCAVEVKGRLWCGCADLDSSNGTFVGDERIRSAELHHLLGIPPGFLRDPGDH